MVTVQQAIGLVGLVIAGVGPLPLWMHHAASHAPAAIARSEARNCCCCGQHNSSVATAEGARDSSLRFSVSEDDCFICYQLAQVGAAAQPASGLSLFRMQPSPATLADQPLIPAAFDPNPARGPPAV